MKKIIRKSLIGVLMCCFVVSFMINTAIVNSEAASSTSFNCYLRDYIKNNDSYKFIYDMEVPNRFYVEKLDNDAKFQAGVTLWRAGTLDIEESVDDITQTNQFKQYVAVLIDVLTNNINTENSAELYDDFFDVVNMSSVKKYNKIVMADLDAAIKKGSTEEVKKLLESIGCFNEVVEIIDKAGDWIGYVSDGVDLIEKCLKMQYISELNQSYHNILNIMYNNCDNEYMAAAINYVSSLCSGDLSADEITLILTGQYAAEELVSESWKVIKKL